MSAGVSRRTQGQGTRKEKKEGAANNSYVGDSLVALGLALRRGLRHTFSNLHLIN